MSWLGRASRWTGTRSWLLQLATGFVAVSVPALAADWSLKFGTSETLIFDDNLSLEETSGDAALTSSTSVNLDLLAKAKTYKIELAPAVSVQKTFFSHEPDDWSYFPAATLGLSKSTKLTTYDLSASVSRAEASANELVEDVISVDEGDVLTYAVTGTVTHKVNDRNSLSWSNSASMVDYTLESDDLVPSLSLRSSGTWDHEITSLVSANLMVSADYYEPDSATVDSRLIYRSTAGLKARLSKRLSVSGAVGAVLLDPEDEGLTADVIFNVSADYKLKSTNYTFSAARDLSPSQDGDLQDRYSTRFGVAHRVNDLMTLGLSGSYSFQTGSDDAKSSALTISPSLNYQLSQDWNSSLSYRFIQTDDADTSAHSNAVTLSLSYGTFLLP